MDTSDTYLSCNTCSHHMDGTYTSLTTAPQLLKISMDRSTAPPLNDKAVCGRRKPLLGSSTVYLLMRHCHSVLYTGAACAYHPRISMYSTSATALADSNPANESHLNTCEARYHKASFTTFSHYTYNTSPTSTDMMTYATYVATEDSSTSVKAIPATASSMPTATLLRQRCAALPAHSTRTILDMAVDSSVYGGVHGPSP